MFEKMLSSNAYRYLVTRELPDGQVSRCLLATIEGDPKRRPVIIKIAREPEFDACLENEARILGELNRRIQDAGKAIRLTVPELLDVFTVNGREAVTTDYADGYYTLEELRERFPEGVPPQHVAWMVNKIFASLCLVHVEGFVHGHVLPCNVLIRSGNARDELRHTGVLIDWINAVQRDEAGVYPKIPAVDYDYEAFYPREILDKEPPSPASDIYMAASCAIYLLGGNVETGELPDNVPSGMVRHLQTYYRAKNPAQRPQAIDKKFYEDFMEMLEIYYGKPKFVELPIPNPK